MCAPDTYHILSNTPPDPLKPGATCRSQRVAKAAIRAGLEAWPEGGGGRGPLLGEQPVLRGSGKERQEPEGTTEGLAEQGVH